MCILVCRTEVQLGDHTQEKLGEFQSFSLAKKSEVVQKDDEVANSADGAF
jgi:hypothetical protein